jgi:stage 0 sporulation regulatory protein
MGKNQSEQMLEEINSKREMMMACANKNGFTSEETIRFSQELDELINNYQRILCESKRPCEELRFSLRQIIMNWPKELVDYL